MKKSFAIVAALVTALSTWAVTTEDYAKHFTITVPTDLGEQVFENFPVLVRLSTDIVGFDYADFKVEGGGDMIFTDDGGTVLSHEIDTWDTTGTSLVWVKAPSLTGGTVLHCYYSGPDASSAVTATDTWSDYAGVWHLGEAGDAGTSHDSTAHGLDGENGASTTQYSAGAIGAARQIYYDQWGQGTTYGQGIVVPSYDNLEVGGAFTVSGWFYHASGGMYYDNLFNRPGGFTVKTSEANFKKIGLLGKGAECKSADIDFPSLVKEKWTKCDFIFNASEHKGHVYVNGVFLSDVNMWNADNDAVDSGTPLCIGAPLSSTVEEPSKSAWNGRVDEVRLRKGVLSAEWIAAEYAMETRPDMLTYSAVTDVSATLALVVAVLPEGMGNPVPAEGRYMAGEVPSVITSGTNYFANGVCYRCSEYLLEVSSDNGGTWSEPVLKSGSDMSFEPSDKALRVTWIWKPHASRVTADANRTSARIVFGSAPYAVDETGAQYFQIGTTVTATALDETSLGCRMWLLSDGTTVNGEEFSFTVGGTPVSAMAVLSYPWAYVATKDEAGKTVRQMTDGEWLFRSDLQSNGFGLKELLQAAPSGVLVIPASCTNDSRGVMLLGNQLFKDSTALKVLILPEAELSLEGGTFSGCTSLERVEPFLPATVTFTGNAGYCFNGCTSLTGDLRLVNPNLSAFPAARNFQNTKITSVYAPYLTKILEFDFGGCKDLTNVVVGEQLQSIGRGAFSGDSVLETMTPFLPDSVNTIGANAFENCPLLTGALSLKSLESISEKAFNGTMIRSVESLSLTNVQKYAFGADSGSAVTNVVFGPQAVNLSYYCPMSMQSSGGTVFFPGNAPLPQFGSTTFGATDYKIRIYCDPVMDPDGWTALMQSSHFQPLTEDDKARSTYPGDKTLGILLSSNSRKYWLIRYRSPLRKPGMVLLVR